MGKTNEQNVQGGCLIATLIVAAIILLYINSPRDSSPADRCKDNIGAFVISQTFVKRQLKAPGTADFPYINADGVSSTPTTLSDGKCAFSVNIYVDAQNSFGANLREHFHLTVAPDQDSSETWSLIDIQSLD